MFSNLKKKIEAEVGDLSRLTPSLRSMTSNSEKMTPLSSRHNSVSSLASETSVKVSSPMSPPYSASLSASASGSMSTSTSDPYGVGAVGGKLDNGRPENPQKLKRVYEKLQTQELDFAWQLSSKDDEISKLQKQVEHLNSLLHSKEFETQQKLVRVQEDMDSLEGFSQQENAKIKHLLLNREEELSQQRAEVMMRDSTISEFETQVKSVTVENERLKRSLDEVVGRSGLSKSAEEVKKERDRCEEVESRLMNITSEHSVVLDKLKEYSEENAHLHSEIDKISKNIGVLEAELEAGRNQFQSVQNEQERVLKVSKAREVELERVLMEKEALLICVQSKLNESVAERNQLQETIVTVQEQLNTAKKSGEEGRDKLNELTKELDKVKVDKTSLEASALELQSREETIKSLENSKEALKSALLSLKEESTKEVNELRAQLSQTDGLVKELEEKESQLCTLETAMQSLETENSEQALEISEIQSKFDQLEEENKFMKEDSQKPAVLEEKLAEMETELAEKTQMLKQQSHQLQDLRRSLAKEINKNQAESLSGQATPPVSNGGVSAQLVSSPPTLPPQETDVNFMYLRSVLFKFLTTTDVQVTQQLTKVVATLLHLSDEETNLLSQSTDSRNSWISHLISKS